MSFYFPLGLLALLGIPVLILIYIIKSKYTEQTIASTYLWELSEKFLKRRRPVSKLTGILTLILQILAVVAASLLIAHPVFTLPASANDFYFILDGSASMNMQVSGSTRFEKAQEKMCELIDGSLNGSSYSLVFASDTTDVVFEGVKDKEQAKATIKALSAGWNDTDCSTAMTFAQTYFDENPSADFYLLTDKEYETANMTLVDVSGGENNIAITEYSYSPVFTGSVRTGVKANGKVVSYSEDASVTVAMSVTKSGSDDTQKIAEVTVDAVKGEPVEFTLTGEAITYASLEIRIVNSDALEEDNVVVLYDEAAAQARKVLFVSDRQDSVYLISAITAMGDASVERVTPKKYEEGGIVQNYGLYVFNGYTPTELPKNAAIWLVNAIDGSGKGSRVTFRNYEEPRDEEGPDSYFQPSYTAGNTVLEKALTENLIGSEVAVRKYAKYGVPRNFTTVMKIGADPVIAAGLNENNDRQVVFAFEIGDSNFGGLGDFLILTKNLLNYSFPAVIDETSYVCGDIMAVNVVPGCENIAVKSPSGKSTTLDTVDNDVCEFQLNETGSYTVTVKLKGMEEDTVLKVFASVPEEESRSEGGGFMLLSGEKQKGYSDGFYDDILAFLIIIAVLLLADWGVYCYEQYQLR